MQSEQITLKSLISPISDEDRIACLPLQFQYMPVEILSKEFTKLNSRHPYRIHFLGPRPINSMLLHKKYSGGEGQTAQHYQKYKINLKKIVSSNFINEKLQNNHYYKSAIFYRAFQGMNPTLPATNQYIFNSSFQSGNLDCVIKITPVEFDLFLRIDSNTRGHTTWYYFSVKNSGRKQKITFNLCNLTKPKNLYEQGMKPYVFSKQKWARQKKGWQQSGFNCKFQQKQLRYQIVYEKISIPSLYCLTFEYQFQFQEDEVFFAYSVPYTYSQLMQDIRNLPQNVVKIDTIGRSLTGVDIPILHITNHEQDPSIKKKNIVITARAHPGQSNGSYLLNGFMNFLADNSKEAIELRNRVNFFIIPMINPDGVIMGNTRTSAAGKDLNRQFHTSRKELYPEVFAIKTFTAKLQRRHGIIMYLDFHGHSNRKNTFMYGPTYTLGDSEYYKCRVLPKLIEKLSNTFRFYSCSFMISESKKTTARAVMLSQMKIPYTYTIESSIGLYYDSQQMKTLFFNRTAWEEMGGYICKGLSQFIEAYQQYQNLIKERKALRMKQRERKGAVPKKYGKKFEEDNEEDVITIKKGNAFSDLLQEVKTAAAQIKNFDAQASSDDHDQKQNLQSFKLAEFNNLIIQNTQKEAVYSKSKQIFEEDFNIVPVSSIDVEQEVIVIPNNSQVSPESKFKRKADGEDQIRSTNKKWSFGVKSSFQAERTKTPIGSPNAVVRSKKNFVVSNKERYNIVAKNLFPVEDKCQILSLPKNIQNIRKQLKKGRNLINNLWQTKKESVKHLPSQTIYPRKRIIQQKDHQTLNFRFLDFNWQGVGKKPNPIQSRTIYRSSANHLDPAPMDSFPMQSTTFNRLKKSVSQAGRMNQADTTYMALQGIQIDNLAMVIKTFKRPA